MGLLQATNVGSLRLSFYSFCWPCLKYELSAIGMATGRVRVDQIYLPCSTKVVYGILDPYLYLY
jgi:hypothetical protein